MIYLIFNEGYSATAGEDWVRPVLCEDALRLGRILAELMPADAEVHGLVALMEMQASRLRARVGRGGEPVLLLDQDRSRWDWLLIRRGLVALARAEQLGEGLGPYGLQAAIAACHARARVPEATDWVRIAALYDALAALAALADRRAQPRGGRGDGVRPGGRARARRPAGRTSRRCAPTTCCPACAASCWPGSGAARRRPPSSAAPPRSPQNARERALLLARAQNG